VKEKTTEPSSVKSSTINNNELTSVFSRTVGVYPTSDVEGAGVGFISGGRASTFELAFGLRRPKKH
jgi:hypothetical protein